MRRPMCQIGAIVLSSLAPMATADSVQVVDLGPAGNPGRQTPVTLAGGLTFADGSTSKWIWAGARTFLIDGALTHGFNLQLTQTHADGQFERVAISDAISSDRASAIGALFSGYDRGRLSDREQAVAFQLVLWEILYDYDGSYASLDYRSGNVQAGMVKSSLFELMKLSALRGGSPSGLQAVTSDYSADILTVAVPLPSAACLGGVGLLLAAGARHRRIGTPAP